MDSLNAKTLSGAIFLIAMVVAIAVDELCGLGTASIVGVIGIVASLIPLAIWKLRGSKE